MELANREDLVEEFKLETLRIFSVCFMQLYLNKKLRESISSFSVITYQSISVAFQWHFSLLSAQIVYKWPEYGLCSAPSVKDHTGLLW